ncbi:MAG: putative DNA binding domain-containing protein [Bifidobacteriaceae bacterium]|jgi:ATP-dependent DNA helicase RecG|nr:putative DNA binding domain-containing protein [Bifidobacteriaceae bacterium]
MTRNSRQDSLRDGTAAFDTSVGPLAEIVAGLRTIGTDTARVEAKAARTGLPHSVWETVSAFSNSDGGVIVLGLDEHAGFTPVAGFDPSRVEAQFISGASDGQGLKVMPQPHYTIDTAVVDGSPVVVVDIAPLEVIAQPCYVLAQGVLNGSYSRRGDGDRHLSAYAIYLLQANRTRPRDDTAGIPGADIQDLDTEAVTRYLARLRAEDRAALADHPTDTEALTRLSVIGRDGRPTLAGLLALGRYPQEFLPQLVVTIAAFPTDHGEDQASGIRLLDSRTIDGPIPRMLTMAVTAVAHNLRTVVLGEGLGGLATPEIPLGALREAIANALIHRDYSSNAVGQQVQIDIYPSRIDITSPGGLFGGRSIEDALAGGSVSRNPALAAILTDTTLPDSAEAVAENKGTGLRRILGLIAHLGLPEPQFANHRTHFTVTFTRPGAAAPLALNVNHRTAALSPRPAPAAKIAAASDQPTARERAILDLISRTGGPVSAKEVAAQLALTPSQAQRAIRNLLDMNRLAATAPTCSKRRAYISV